MADKQEYLKSIVDVGYSVMTTYQNKVQNGELTQEQAQIYATQEINSLRYAGKEYYFAYDLEGTTKILGSDPKKNRDQ